MAIQVGKVHNTHIHSGKIDTDLGDNLSIARSIHLGQEVMAVREEMSHKYKVVCAARGEEPAGTPTPEMMQEKVNGSLLLLKLSTLEQVEWDVVCAFLDMLYRDRNTTFMWMAKNKHDGGGRASSAVLKKIEDAIKSEDLQLEGTYDNMKTLAYTLCGVETIMEAIFAGYTLTKHVGCGYTTADAVFVLNTSMPAWRSKQLNVEGVVTIPDGLKDGAQCLRSLRASTEWFYSSSVLKLTKKNQKGIADLANLVQQSDANFIGMVAVFNNGSGPVGVVVNPYLKRCKYVLSCLNIC
jgi:hypothetical protein